MHDILSLLFQGIVAIAAIPKFIREARKLIDRPAKKRRTRRAG